MNNLFLKPVLIAGVAAVVRQPDRDFRLLDAAGEWVVPSAYWRARIAQGDVVESPPPFDPFADQPAGPALSFKNLKADNLAKPPEPPNAPSASPAPAA